jgi:hypothetical protein
MRSRTPADGDCASSGRTRDWRISSRRSTPYRERIDFVNRYVDDDEAAGEYEGTIFVGPRDSAASCEALRRLPALKGQAFADSHSWERSIDRFEGLFGEMSARRRA